MVSSSSSSLRWLQVPEGYEKVGRDMTKGTPGRKSYLCVRRLPSSQSSSQAPKEDEEGDAVTSTSASTSLPIEDVHIVYGDEEPGPYSTLLLLPLLLPPVLLLLPYYCYYCCCCCCCHGSTSHVASSSSDLLSSVCC